MKNQISKTKLSLLVLLLSQTLAGCDDCNHEFEHNIVYTTNYRLETNCQNEDKGGNTITGPAVLLYLRTQSYNMMPYPTIDTAFDQQGNEILNREDLKNKLTLFESIYLWEPDILAMDTSEKGSDYGRVLYSLTTKTVEKMNPSSTLLNTTNYTTFTPEALTSWEYSIRTTNNGANCKALLTELPDVDLSGLAKTVYQEMSDPL